MSNLLAKLGASGRTEAAAIAGAARPRPCVAAGDGRRVSHGGRAGPRGGRAGSRRKPLLAELDAVQPRRRDGCDLTPARGSRCSRLLAQGLTNGQIGKQLYISTKTVSVHVSNLLAKLGASGRTEAAALARGRGARDRLEGDQAPRRPRATSAARPRTAQARREGDRDDHGGDRHDPHRVRGSDRPHPQGARDRAAEQRTERLAHHEARALQPEDLTARLRRRCASPAAPAGAGSRE